MKFTSSTTFGQDELLDLDRRRHEVEQRRVAEVVLERRSARSTSSRLRSRVCSARHVVDLLARRVVDLRRCTAPSCFWIAARSAVSLLDARGSASFSLALLVRDELRLLVGARQARRRATPRSRSGPGRRSPWRTGSRCVARIEPVVDVLQLAPAARRPSAWFAATFCSAAVCAAPRAAAACSCPPPASACCSCACVTWYSQLREPPLRVLPVAVVVVPDHPDDRQEQEQAGRREDDVQEVDVVRVPDALLFSHDSDVEEEFRDAPRCTSG